MGKILRENKIFFLLCLTWFVVAGVYLLIFDKGVFSLWMNKNHSPAADTFFRYATWLGDGYTVGIACLFLFFVKLRYGIITSLVSFTSAFLISLLKDFYNEARPSLYFQGQEIHFVEGLKLYQWHSFPSGHTAAAFTLFCLFAIFVKNKSYGYLFFGLALLVAFSRVYLMQHCLVDVYFGSLFGLIFTLVLYQLIMITPLFRNKKWHERSVLNRKQESKSRDQLSIF